LTPLSSCPATSLGDTANTHKSPEINSTIKIASLLQLYDSVREWVVFLHITKDLCNGEAIMFALWLCEI
jgi:hypothetical protein